MSRLERILDIANTPTWSGPTPQSTLRLTIAIDSLRTHRPRFWDDNADALRALLETNPGVSNIFNEFDERTIGFAIRLARLNEAHETI